MTRIECTELVQESAVNQWIGFSELVPEVPENVQEIKDLLHKAGLQRKLSRKQISRSVRHVAYSVRV